MRLIRLRDLAKQLGIPRRTIQKWISKDPELAILKKGGPGGKSYWIKLEVFATKRGLSLMDAYALPNQRWIKATELATMSGISRKTVCNWCESRPGFGKRLGRVWYVDLESFGATPEDVARALERLKAGPPEPNCKSEE